MSFARSSTRRPSGFVLKLRHVLWVTACLGIVHAVQGATVTYTMQTGNFNSLQTERNNNPPYAGTYNNGATELANYANNGSFGNTPGAAAFQTFTTTGNGTSGTTRALQVGDTFTITAYVGSNPSAGGRIGISFRDSTTYTNFASSTDAATEARFQIDNTGNWKVYGNSTVESGSGSAADRTFVIKITSDTTFDAQVGGTWYYNNTMAASGGTIDSFAIYTFGDSNPNSFWKNASLSDTGSVEVGYSLASGNYTPGVISDGLAANSTSTSRANTLNVGGDAGSQVNLDKNNTYTGATTINANATAEAQHANALGTTAAGTTVSNGGALKLYNATGISYASEALTLNGTGVNTANGSLRSVGGNNTWNGAITLNSNSRINADNSSGSAASSLAIAGNVGGGSNVLFLGANGANISISGAISGAGNTQSSTTTSLFKDGANTLTLSGNNTYTGDTRVTAGTLTVASGGNLGSGSDVFVSSGATLNINTNTTVASLQETGTSNGGVVAIGNGAVLTVNGADKGTLFQNSISGAGGLTMAGSGTTSLSLYGTQSFSGATTVSGGKISTAVAMSTSGVTVSGGTFETSAANILGDSASVSVSSGTYTLGGNDTVGSFTISGGTLGGSSTLTTSTYALNGGTVSANLGAGTLNVGGSATLNGTAGATTVNVNSGTLTLGGSNRLSTSAAAAVSGTLALGANSQTLTALTGNGTVSTTSGGALTLNIASGTNTFGGALTGAGGLTKSGLGKLVLSGTNTLSGTTTISAGELAVNGSLSGGVTVNSSTTLSGTGTIGGATTISGTHTPGASPGLQTFSNGLTYNASSVLVWELSSNTNTVGNRGVLFDGIDVTGGDLTIANGASIELDFTAALSNGTPSSVTWFDSFWDSNRSWTIIDKSGAGSSTGVFTITDISTALGGWAYNTVRPNSSFTINNSGGDIVLNWNTATAIPEPSSALLALVAGCGLCLRRRRN